MDAELATPLTNPQRVPVNRTDLRQNQSLVLGKAEGTTVVVVGSPSAGSEEKYILSKRYFEELLSSVGSLIETLEIMADQKLFGQILAAADTLEDDLRLGKLYSLEEVFGEEDESPEVPD